MLHELERAVAEDPRGDGKPALGMFAGARLPFDRLMAAARCAGAKLVSRDSALHELGLVDVGWG